MQSLEGNERRKYPRSKRRLQMVLEDGGPGVLNHVDNISESGVLCHTVKPVALMTKIGVIMDLPKPIEYRIESEGVVVRCEPDELGDDHFKVAIFLPKLTEIDKDAIRAFLLMDNAEEEIRKQ